MKSSSTLPLLLLLLVPTSCVMPTQEISSAELKAHVQWLASDAQEGRRAGSPGAYRSGDYLVRQLQAAGLQPGGEDGNWFQEFKIQMPPEQGTCSLQVAGESIEGVGTVAASPSADAKGSLVAVAYGVDSDVNVDNKVVLMRRYTASGVDDTAENKALGNLRKKIRNMAAAGAVGVILGTHPDDAAKGGRSVVGFKDVQGVMPIPVVTIGANTFANLEARCKNSAEAMPVHVVAEVVEETRMARNVLAKAPGISSDWIVVGAHYDHLGWGGEGSLAPGVHAIHNGADDNASGTAMTVELAEAWGQRMRQQGPDARGILFCLWSGEELGLLGSAYWVAHPTVPLGDILCNVNLDMVGRLGSHTVTIGSAATAAAFESALQHAQDALDASGITLDLNVMQTEMLGGGGSDHMSFHAVEIPAVFFFSGLHSDYHKPSDDWQKVSFAGMEGLSVALVDFLEQMELAPLPEFAFVKPKAPEHQRKGRRGLGDGVWFGSLPDYGAMPERGMQITGTASGSPAEKAGLQSGDIIVQLGDFAIGDIYDFMDSLAEFHKGQTVTVTVLRDGKSQELSITFFPRP